MITVTFVLDCFHRPEPSYAYNTRYEGRILYRTTMKPDETFETLLEPLYKHSRCTPAWTLWWNDLYPCDVRHWPSGIYGEAYGKNNDREIIIFCREP
jgi:hypothetical protein